MVQKRWGPGTQECTAARRDLLALLGNFKERLWNL